MTEIFKKICGFENYEISNLGRIKSHRGFVKPSPKYQSHKRYRENKKLAYMHVNLWDYSIGKSVLRNVGRLVLETFIGPCPEKMELCHNDGNPANNRLENLRWDTHSSNMLDKRKHGTAPYPSWLLGTGHYRTKFTDQQIKIIKLHPKFRGSNAYLGKLFGVTREAIREIVNGRNWKHIEV